MRIVQCKEHGVKFVLPTKEQEFLSGKYHEAVEECHSHHELNPNCKFVEVQE